ncbi:hypothetical protein TNCV_2671821 [Trichonephila clavipes]|nr:hypothetical protein TNCV_2671821 [Trichonephila clavipes]
MTSDWTVGCRQFRLDSEGNQITFRDVRHDRRAITVDIIRYIFNSNPDVTSLPIASTTCHGTLALDHQKLNGSRLVNPIGRWIRIHRFEMQTLEPDGTVGQIKSDGNIIMV